MGGSVPVAAPFKEPSAPPLVAAPIQHTRVERTMPTTADGKIFRAQGTMGRPTWGPDHEVFSCSICTKEFNLLRRRHHCRACGRVVCKKCSPTRMVLQFEHPTK